MKEKVLKILKSNLLFAVIINAAVMFVCIAFFSFSYDSPDDFYNSLYICQNQYYYSFEINYILATIVGMAQFILPGFNCFVLAQVLLSCGAFTTISYVFADKFSKRKSLFLTLIINILFALDHYANILSSKTAALLIAAGFLLALNAIRNKRYNLPFWIGLLEILFGSFFCFEYFWVGLAFAVAFFFGDMISKRKYKLPFRKFFWYFRPFLLVFVFIFLLGAGAQFYSYSVNNSSFETANYYEYAKLSDSIGKYPLPDYSKYSEEFKTVGIDSSNDYEMLKSGYYDADKFLNNDALKLVNQIQSNEHSYNVFTEISNISYDIWNHIISFDSIAYFITAYLIISVLYIIFQKKRFAFFPIFFLIIAFCSCLYIRYTLDSYAYDFYGIWLMMLVYLIYSFDFEHIKENSKLFLQHQFKISVILWSSVFVVTLISYSFVYQSGTHQTSGSKPSTLYTEINRHPERYYVLDPISAQEYLSKCDNYTHPLWGFKKGFIDNIDGFGYFHRQDQLVKRNLPTNIYEAILTNKNIYVVDNNIVFKKEKYFNEYYVDEDKYAAYTEVKEINGFKIYHLVTE